MTSVAPSFLNGSFSFLQVMKTTIRAWISLSFGQIPSPTTELAALERLKIDVWYDVVTTLALKFRKL